MLLVGAGALLQRQRHQRGDDAVARAVGPFVGQAHLARLEFDLPDHVEHQPAGGVGLGAGEALAVAADQMAQRRVGEPARQRQPTEAQRVDVRQAGLAAAQRGLDVEPAAERVAGHGDAAGHPRRAGLQLDAAGRRRQLALERLVGEQLDLALRQHDAAQRADAGAGMAAHQRAQVACAEAGAGRIGRRHRLGLADARHRFERQRERDERHRGEQQHEADGADGEAAQQRIHGGVLPTVTAWARAASC